MNYLIAIALFLIGGYAFGRGAGLLRLPGVIGYVVFGMIVGPSVLGLFTAPFLDEFAVIEIIALSFIAYQIGGELGFRQLHREGKALGLVVLAQALMTYLIVAGCIWLLTREISLSLILAATAVATAPAAVKSVLDEQGGRNAFSTFLYHVVAIDDFFAILFFALTVSLLGVEQGMVVSLLREIGGALLLGFLLGYGIYWLRKLHAGGQTLLVYEVGGLFLGAGLSVTLDFSYLLTGIVFGFTLVNLTREDRSLFALSRRLERMIYIVFFVLIGARLELERLPEMGWVGLVYILGRALGKYLGTSLGALAGGAHKAVRIYLGAALLPQAGVSIGLVYVLGERYPELSQEVSVIVLAAIVVNELLGPLGVRWAVSRTARMM